MVKSNKPLPIHKLINFLFEQIRKKDGYQYTNTEVATAIGISKSSLTLIRNGDQNNPTLNTIRAILNFFDVPSTYLDSSSEEEALRIIEISSPNNEIKLRLRNLDNTELSPRTLNQIQQIVKYTLELHKAQEQGLPEPDLPEFTSKEIDSDVDNLSE